MEYLNIKANGLIDLPYIANVTDCYTKVDGTQESKYV